ncbi:MAG: CHC2 zinc finger domain-containing protein [Bryobacteraceae bacterium]
MTAETIARALNGRKSGRGWMARCPVHADKGPSLSIAEGAGKPVVHCFGGCPQAAVIGELRARGLWSEPERIWTPAERRDWAKERRGIAQNLPAARSWRRSAVALAEAVLQDLKSALIDPIADAEPSCPDEIARWTSLLLGWTGATDGTLVAIYLDWREREPELTAAMVSAAKIREQGDKQALWQFIEEMAE